MIDVRKAVAEQIGLLVLQTIEQAAQINALMAENQTLKKTQSEGKAQAEAHLREQPEVPDDAASRP